MELNQTVLTLMYVFRFLCMACVFTAFLAWACSKAEALLKK